MHDNSVGGQAVKDRTMAFWTDKNNFPVMQYTTLNKNTSFARAGRGFLAALVISSVIGQ